MRPSPRLQPHLATTHKQRRTDLAGGPAIARLGYCATRLLWGDATELAACGVSVDGEADFE